MKNVFILLALTLSAPAADACLFGRLKERRQARQPMAVQATVQTSAAQTTVTTTRTTRATSSTVVGPPATVLVIEQPPGKTVPMPRPR